MALTILTGSSQAAGVNYSYRTSGSADWSSVPTASYFYDQIDKITRYKMPNGDIVNSISSSFASTASYALNAGGSGLGYAIVSGSVTASVDVGADIFLIKSASSTFFTINSQGATTISSSAQNIFTIKGANNHQKLAVSQSGILVLATHSMDPTGFAPVGAIYFTSSSLWVGLE